MGCAFHLGCAFHTRCPCWLEAFVPVCSRQFLPLRISLVSLDRSVLSFALRCYKGGLHSVDVDGRTLGSRVKHYRHSPGENNEMIDSIYVVV